MLLLWSIWHLNCELMLQMKVIAGPLKRSHRNNDLERLQFLCLTTKIVCVESDHRPLNRSYRNKTTWKITVPFSDHLRIDSSLYRAWSRNCYVPLLTILPFVESGAFRISQKLLSSFYCPFGESSWPLGRSDGTKPKLAVNSSLIRGSDWASSQSAGSIQSRDFSSLFYCRTY